MFLHNFNVQNNVIMTNKMQTNFYLSIPPAKKKKKCNELVIKAVKAKIEQINLINDIIFFKFNV